MHREHGVPIARAPAMDAYHVQRRNEALCAPNPGPGFRVIRSTDATTFGQVLPQSQEFWGALSGTFIISAKNYAPFVSMLRVAADASRIRLTHTRNSPVRIGLHEGTSVLATGGPFDTPLLSACTEVWGLSVDDWGRLLLHAVYYGRQSSSLSEKDCPPAVARALQCCLRRIQGLTDHVAGSDLSWRILPAVPPGAGLKGQLLDRQALVFAFLQTKEWVASNINRRYLRAVWDHVYAQLVGETQPMVRKDGIVSHVPVANNIISSSAGLFEEIGNFAGDLRAKLRDVLGGQTSEKWLAAARVAVVWGKIGEGRMELRPVETKRVTDAEVCDELLRSYQVSRVIRPRSCLSVLAHRGGRRVPRRCMGMRGGR